MSKKIFAGVGIVAALGVVMVPVANSFAVGTTTYIKATVDEFVGCTSSNDTAATALNLGNISAGQKKDANFTISGSTNSPKGFRLTGAPQALAHTNGTDSIAYSASEVAAEAEGWYLSTVEGSTDGITIGSTIVLNSASLANERQNTWTVKANVSTATTTTTGVYSGEINWTCIVNE